MSKLFLSIQSVMNRSPSHTMSANNQPMEFDDSWFNHVTINGHAIQRYCESLNDQVKCLGSEEKIETLLKTIQLIDLTTLAGDDTYVNVQRLCYRGLQPLSKTLTDKIHSTKPDYGVNDLRVAAVCVYPARINDCHDAFELANVKNPLPIASVVTGFPSGQYGFDSRLKEIDYAEECLADEIDVVIDRSRALDGDWKEVYQQVKRMRNQGPKMKMKVILEVGELGSYANVYKASLAAMMAGADFIKTSTGKVTINATLPVGFVMTRAIDEFYSVTGVRVGFKPAGGLRTEQDCYKWIKLIDDQLGEEWLKPDYFRIGASSLLNEIEKSLFKMFFKRDPYPYETSI